MPGTLILSDRETAGKKKKNRNVFLCGSVWARSLVVQVMRNQSEPLRTSIVLNERKPWCMFQNSKGCSALYLLLHSLSFHSNKYLPTRAIHSVPASIGRTSKQQAVPCFPSFINRDAAVGSGPKPRARIISSCKNSSFFPLKCIIRKFQRI